MLGFLFKKGNNASFLAKWEAIRALLGDEIFYAVFPVILCDNGTETTTFYKMEFSSDDGVQKGRVFYCDPYSSFQKGSIERNHRFIRRVIPKSKSFDNNYINDAFIKEMFSQINAIPRDKLDNKTPHSLFKEKYGVCTLDKLGIHFVDPREVNLMALRDSI